MTTTKEANKTDTEILTYQPLAADNAVSANPHIPSVSASAVLGESESVSFVYNGNLERIYLCAHHMLFFDTSHLIASPSYIISM